MPNSEPDATRELAIPLYNVGLGAAKTVTIVWAFPIDEMVSQINALAQQTLTSCFFSLENGVLSVKSEGLGESASMWRNQQSASLDFVLPATVQKDPIELRLPIAYIQLCSAFLFLSAKDEKKTVAWDLPVLTAKMGYLDIGEHKHQSRFELRIHVIALAASGQSIYGYVDARKCP